MVLVDNDTVLSKIKRRRKVVVHRMALLNNEHILRIGSITSNSIFSASVRHIGSKCGGGGGQWLCRLRGGSDTSDTLSKEDEEDSIEKSSGEEKTGIRLGVERHLDNLDNNDSKITSAPMDTHSGKGRKIGNNENEIEAGGRNDNQDQDVQDNNEEGGEKGTLQEDIQTINSSWKNDEEVEGIDPRGKNNEEQAQIRTGNQTSPTTTETEEPSTNITTNSNSCNPQTINSVVKERLPNNDEMEIKLHLEAEQAQMRKYQLLEDVNKLRENALQLRTKGKQLHDVGDFTFAAQKFYLAAQKLEKAMTAPLSLSSVTTAFTAAENEEVVDGISNDEKFLPPSLNPQLISELAEECATCLLHQALCHLKNKNYAESIQSCTDVLKDGVQIITIEEEDGDGDGDGTYGEEGDEEDERDRVAVNKKKSQKAAVVRISPNGGAGASGIQTLRDDSTGIGNDISPQVQLSTAVRARAFHRRAKARLALGDSNGALDDSRSAAYLGDRNAVKLYGRLMRETASGGSLDSLSNRGDDEKGFWSNGEEYGEGDSSGSGQSVGDLFSSASVLDSLFANETTDKNILKKQSSSSSEPSPFDILNSLMGSGNSSPTTNPLNTFGGMGSILNGVMGGVANGASGSGVDSLAKSVLMSITKRMEDESTQENIAKYLRTLDVAQITSLSSMAGIPLNESSAEKMVSIANGITPIRIRKGIKLTKRVVSCANIIRKLSKVIKKYKHLLVLFVLIAWVKSAILQPVVVSKKALRRAAKEAAKKVIQDSLASASFIM